MYSEKKIRQIILSLLEGTRTGFMKWGLSNSIFNSDTSHRMMYTNDTGDTNFVMKVELENDGYTRKTSTVYLYINNDDLVDDGLQTSSYDYKELDELNEIVYDKFVKPNLTPAKKGTLDNILGTINKGYVREKKIDTILEDDKNRKFKWPWQKK